MEPEPKTISVTELRERTREILENAHFRGRRYRVERAGQPMVVIVGAEEYRSLIAVARQASASRDVQPGNLGASL